jgi:hypothetical protein
MTAALIAPPDVETQAVTPDTPRSAARIELRARPVQRRWHARVVSAVYTSDGWVRSFVVKCPFCRGRHSHSAWGSTTFASPHCGTPGVYRVIWPETTAPAEPTDDHNESSR